VLKLFLTATLLSIRASSNLLGLPIPRHRNVWPSDKFDFQANVATFFGEQFGKPLAGQPRSAFIADGSFVSGYGRTKSIR
jgi:hypothetical protein